MSEVAGIPTLEEFESEIIRFPLDAFPVEFQKMIESIQKMTGFRNDAAALMALAILSGCAGKRMHVQGAFGNRKTILNLYVVLGKASGEYKSFLCQRLMQQFHTRHDYFLEVIERRLGKLLVEKKQLEKRLNQNKLLPEEAKRLVDINREFERRRKWDTTNATPEALIGMLADNYGELFLYSPDAGGTLAVICGKYGNGKGDDWDILLLSFVGDPISKDRVASTSARAKDPFLSMLLIAQPGVVEDKFIGLGRSRGLSGRALVLQDDSVVGDEEDIEGDFDNIEWWDQVCDSVLAHRFQTPSYVPAIACSSEAKEIFKGFHKEAREVGREQGFENGETLRWRELAIKIAGLIVVMNHGDFTSPLPPITPKIAKDACRVMRYYGMQNLRLLKEKSAAEDAKAEKDLMDEFFRLLRENGGELMRGEFHLLHFRKEKFRRLDSIIGRYADKVEVVKKGKGTKYRLLDG